MDVGAADVGPAGRTDEVDLLIVVDNREHLHASTVQLATADVLRSVVILLLSGERSTLGGTDVPPVRSLHVGVVSGDMGIGDGSPLDGCTPLGQDGILSADGSFGGTGCAPSYPSAIFDFDASSTRDELAAPTCVARMNTSGCGAQQLMDAALKALSPASDSDGHSSVEWTRAGYVPPVFWGGSHGHGGPGGANAGFVRPDSVLVTWLASPFDDCSTASPHIFSYADPRTDPSGLICYTSPDPRYSLERFSEGFSGLRRHPSRFVLWAAAGIPLGTESLSYEDLLAHPRMQEVLAPAPPDRPTHVLSVCDNPTVDAWPARRIVGVADRLRRGGAGTFVYSVCDDITQPLLSQLLGTIDVAVAGEN